MAMWAESCMQLWEQMQAAKKAYDDTKVVKLSDSVRHYWYPNGNDILLYTQANEQNVPVEPERWSGTGDWFSGRRFRWEHAEAVKGVTWKRDGSWWTIADGTFPVYRADKVNASFWMPYTHYKRDGEYYKCPSGDWFLKVYKEDYQMSKSLYNILFDKV